MPLKPKMITNHSLQVARCDMNVVEMLMSFMQMEENWNVDFVLLHFKANKTNEQM